MSPVDQRLTVGLKSGPDCGLFQPRTIPLDKKRSQWATRVLFFMWFLGACFVQVIIWNNEIAPSRLVKKTIFFRTLWSAFLAIQNTNTEYFAEINQKAKYKTLISTLVALNQWFPTKKLFFDYRALNHSRQYSKDPQVYSFFPISYTITRII